MQFSHHVVLYNTNKKKKKKKKLAGQKIFVRSNGVPSSKTLGYWEMLVAQKLSLELLPDEKKLFAEKIEFAR